MRPPGKPALATLPALLATLPSALLAQEATPPIEGDALVGLIGHHRRSSPVQPVLAWGGDGLELAFAGDRVARVRIRVASMGGRLAFPGALPGGLPRNANAEQVRRSAGWSAAGGGTFVRRFVTTWNGRKIDGYELRVGFEGSTFAAVEIAADAAQVHAARSRIVRVLMPATQGQSGRWAAALGADIASDAGALLVAWVGWTAGAAPVERAGLGVRVRDDAWIEELLFRPAFEGARPFDLPAAVTVADLEPWLGAPAGDPGDGAASWHLVIPGSAPYDLAVQEAEAGTTIVLRQDLAQAQAWRRRMTEDAPLAEDIGKDLAQVWRLLQSDFDALKGDEEQQEGLLGTVRWWRSTKPLGGILGGTVHESPEGEVFRTRSVRYLVRRCPEAEGRSPRSLLAKLEPGVAAILGEGWQLTRGDEAEKKTATSAWSPPDADPFGVSAGATLTAARVPSGIEILLELTVPLVPG